MIIGIPLILVWTALLTVIGAVRATVASNE
jgi:hypothetical protein